MPDSLTPETLTNLSFEVPFNNAAEGMILVNQRGVIVQLNDSAQRMFGYEKSELHGQRIEVLVPDANRGKHEADRNGFMNKPHTRPMGKGIDLFARRKDGSTFPVEISLSPFSFNGAAFVLAFVVDITEKKQAEAILKAYYSDLEKEVEKRTLILSEAVAELEKTKSELNEALSKEKKLNDLKSRFVSMVSHEFRTPLATILSSLDLAEKYLDQQDADKQKKHFHRIRHSLKGLTAIMNDVLSLGKLEEGKVTITPEKFNFKTLIEQFVEEMQDISKDGQVIEFRFDGDTEWVHMDRNILKQIVINLISNAIKFSPENSPVSVNAEIHDDTLHFSVQDHGIGIPEEDQKNLFKSFFRGQNASTIQGTGLGLNIVSRYIQLMHGRISFNSVQDEGTRFDIEIPLSMNDV